MYAFWIEHRDGAGNWQPGFTIEARSEMQALGSACAQLPSAQAVTATVIPHPAGPNRSPRPSGCPSFCTSPGRCKGRTACPNRPACTE